MKERAVARVVLPFDLRTDWQRKLRFRDSVINEVATRLRELPQLSFDQVTLALPLLGDIEVSFDQVPPVCRQLQAIPNEVELQVVLVYADDKARDGETGDNGKAFWQLRTLPALDWEQYWDRIYVDEMIKRRALNYCLLAYKLGQWRVSNMCLAQHRIVLFYGPPGTGKTSLALSNGRDRFAIGHPRPTNGDIHIHVVTQPLRSDLQMQLAHPGDQGLPGFRIRRNG